MKRGEGTCRGVGEGAGAKKRLKHLRQLKLQKKLLWGGGGGGGGVGGGGGGGVGGGRGGGGCGFGGGGGGCGGEGGAAVSFSNFMHKSAVKNPVHERGH